MPITRPTTFVLGAGASNPYSYPLGSELFDDVIQQAKAGAQCFQEFPAPWTREDDVLPLVDRMSATNFNSIDSYLEGRDSDIVRLGKFLMAVWLKRCERPERFLRPQERDWYSSLFQLIASDPGSLEGNQVSFVTFNYDRSLEAYIHTILQGHYEISEEDALTELSKIPIAHVHGMLGSYPEVPYTADSSLDELLRLSDQLQIVGDVTDRPQGFATQGFEIANGLIASAEHVVFLGFGFHGDNVARLQIDWSEIPQVSWTAKDMTEKERERLFKMLDDRSDLGRCLRGNSFYSTCLDLLRNVEL